MQKQNSIEKKIKRPKIQNGQGEKRRREGKAKKL